MEYIYNNDKYVVEIIRKNNKNTYIRVKNNIIYVTTNYFSTNHSIKKLINDNSIAINKMIDKSLKKSEIEDSFYLFGKKYDIIYGSFSEIDIVEDKIYASDEKKFNKWLNSYISNIFLEHLNYWYNQFEEKIPVPNLKIRKMTSRWGVCNIKNKNVTLNYTLFKYDIECLDYVIIHELSHFIHPNHSKDFWTLVSKYCFNYKNIRKKLRG